MRRIIARLVALPIFLLGIGGGNGVELYPDEIGASPDETWKCDGPRADLVLSARARPVGDRMRIDLEFENQTEFTVSGISLGKGRRYEWGNDPNEPGAITTSVRSPEEWTGRYGRQFEGVMMTIFWHTPDREKRVPPGGRLQGLSFETRDERLPPADLPFKVLALGTGCMWSRWTLELDSVEIEQ